MIHTKKWFINRIGRKVFRDTNECPCLTCLDVVENGLIIADKDHADHIYCHQNEYAREGIMLNYRDKK